MPQSIFLVDDDPTQRRLMEAVLGRQGYKVLSASGGREAISFIDAGRSGDMSVMLLDLVMPEVDGFAVLEHVKRVLPGLPVIVLTAQGRIDTVVNAMRSGAADFVVKPASPERLLVSIQNAMKLNTLAGEVQRLKRRQNGQLSFDDLIAKAPSMQQVIRLGRRAGASNIPILIEGESGSGKELIAARDSRRLRALGQAVHRRQLRRASREPRREHSVRPRERRLHGRLRKAHASFRKRVGAPSSSTRSASFASISK